VGVVASDRKGRGREPLALILVRNAVSHDARVLREAQTLRGLGYSVLIAGVVSSTARERRLRLDGTEVIRLAPADAIRRVVRPARAIARIRRVRPAPVTAEALTGAANPAARTAGAIVGLRRLAVTAAFYLQGLRLVLRSSPALVHANDYNTMWIGVGAKLLRGSRLIYDCHELWPDRNGRPEWRPWLLACEALFVRLADATVTTSPGYAAALAARYRIAVPVLVRNIPVQAPPPSARQPTNARPVVVYLGGVMPGRGLEQAIDALPRAPELVLRVVGPGRDSYRAGLARRARAAGVGDRVELAPAVPAADVLAAVEGAAVGLMLIQPVCRSYELTLPNKLFEYAAAGIPILASDLPVIGPLVRDQAIGEVVPPGDLELIAAAMLRLAAPSVNAELRRRVRAFAALATWERERAALEGVYGRPGRQ
jgi:glycosyltransferase involved in cell wall biosynthesis